MSGKLIVIPGQLIRGIVIDGKRPKEIQIKMTYNEFTNLLGTSESEREKFIRWFREMVIPALDINGKCSIIFPTHF